MREERALKDYSRLLLNRDAAAVSRALMAGEWIRLRCNDG